MPIAFPPSPFPRFSLGQRLTFQEMGLGGVQSGERVGILTGSFDPPHQGHLDVVQGILASGVCAGIVMIPAVGPSVFKPHRSSVMVRYPLIEAFCQEAISLTQKPVYPLLFKLSKMEEEREEEQETTREKAWRSYESLLRDKDPEGAETVRILGADGLAHERESLKKSSVVADLFTRWIIVSRTGCSVTPEQVQEFQRLVRSPVQQLNLKTCDISSQELRDHFQSGRPAESGKEKALKLLPSAVQRVILEKGLYRRSVA